MNQDPGGHAEAAPEQGAGAGAPMHALPFRKDIEGLRAVAILLVVCAHAGVPWLAGGFVGVDVFFVLSGYLITGLLVNEIHNTGRVRFVSFYARRLQRLFPALLVMVVATAFASAALLAPFEQVTQAHSARMAIGWMSNVQFALENLDYFGSDAEKNIYLHTWSLGVEEQFYLVWPLVLLAFMAQGKRVEQAENRVLHFLLAVVLVGFTLVAWMTFSEQRLAFYMMPARAWQFSLGAAVQLLVCKASRCKQPAPMCGVEKEYLAPLMGLGAILASALIFDRGTPYPGFAAALPTAGTAAILLFPVDAPANRLLSIRPMQWIGKMSYSWYLWHWPVLLLGIAAFESTSPLLRATLAILSLAIAWLTCKWIERPIRIANALRARPRLALLSAVFLMLAAVTILGTWEAYARGQASTVEQSRFSEMRRSRPITYRMGCDDWYRSGRVISCTFGSRSAHHTIVLFGDSIAAQWLPAIRRIYNPGWRIVVITKSSCPIVDRSFVYYKIGRKYVECDTWRDNAVRYIDALQPDVLLISSYFAYPFEPGDWREGTKRVLARLTTPGRGIHIGIIRATPGLPFDPVSCAARHSWRRFILPGMNPCVAAWPSAKESLVGAALLQASATTPNTALVDVGLKICQNGTCVLEREGHFVFRDDKHITSEMATSMTSDLGKALTASGLAPPVSPNPAVAPVAGPPEDVTPNNK